ncbi:MAG: glycosyltransferase family 9 protein [Bdellovibrionales bacterium]|nr:glycosyltransferase family 9 protein [Bdellovibrionales bacterium]
MLLIHLGALGAVVRSTALLASIHRKYPGAHLTWVTEKPAHMLLKDHPLIDRVLTTDQDSLLALKALRFDVGFCIDKSQVAYGIICSTTVNQVFGFSVNAVSGAIQPATAAAAELWELGLSNQKKFFINKKSEIQLVTEALELDYKRDPYHVHLTDKERAMAISRRAEWAPSGQLVVGLNTGCSDVISYKKLSIEAHRDLIIRLDHHGFRVVLLGGPEDEKRNQKIAYGLNVISSPTHAGLRDGLVSVQACDVVVTGDSLGMHMAIGLNKWTVAWFGPTCAHEIDLYEHGVSVISRATCSPCWKRSCHKSPMCYDLVDLNQIVDGVKLGAQWLMSSFTPPFSETSCSVSHSCDTSRESGLSSL